MEEKKKKRSLYEKIFSKLSYNPLEFSFGGQNLYFAFRSGFVLLIIFYLISLINNQNIFYKAYEFYDNNFGNSSKDKTEYVDRNSTIINAGISLDNIKNQVVDFFKESEISKNEELVTNLDNEFLVDVENIQIETYEDYFELDELGRCQGAVALIGPESLPIEARDEYLDIKPTGWHTVRYDELIEDKYLYNRCHLIAYCLTGENANERNLVTGTRAMNLAMKDYETKVVRYIENTGNHVLYRSTPIFQDNELVCRGIHLEAKSIEDDYININVMYNNIQPGIVIDYLTGESYEK